MIDCTCTCLYPGDVLVARGCGDERRKLRARRAVHAQRVDRHHDINQTPICRIDSFGVQRRSDGITHTLQYCVRKIRRNRSNASGFVAWSVRRLSFVSRGPCLNRLTDMHAIWQLHWWVQ